MPLETRIVFLGSIALYGVCAWVCHAKNVRRPVLTAFLVSAVATVSVAVSLGWQGDSWSLSSAVVKMAIVWIACTIPSAIAALVTQLVRVGPFVTRIVAGALCGAVAATFMPILGLILVCMALQDCI